MNIGDQIRQQVQEAVSSLGLPEVEFGVEHPAEESHGDFSTNVALRLGKR